MTVDDVRAVVLALPDTIESSHHGHPDFRRVNKIFATLRPDKNRGALRLPPEVAEALEAAQPSVFQVVARREGASWISVALENTDREKYAELADVAWAGVPPSPKRKR